jgi:pentatricopeptide repeat protein
MNMGKVVPDMTIINILMRLFTRRGKISEAMELYDDIGTKYDLKPDERTHSILLSACGDAGALQEGMKVIHNWNTDPKFKHDNISITCLISFYAKCGMIKEALETFKNMTTIHGLTPDHHTYSILLSTFGRAGALIEGEEIAAHIKTSNLRHTIVTINSQIVLYVKCAMLPKAMKLFQNMQTMYGLVPNERTYIILLSACARIGAPEEGHEIVKTLHASGLKYSLYLFNTLLLYYSRCGMINKAVEMFRDMTVLYDLMPDHHTYSILLSACADAGELVQGEKVATVLKKSGFKHDTYTLNALLLLYTNCNMLQKAMDLFRDMYSQHGVVSNEHTYSILLSSCANAGMLREGQEVEAQLNKSKFKHTIITMTTLISLYAKCEMVETAIELFRNMHSKYGLIPNNDRVYAILLVACTEKRLIIKGDYILTALSRNGVKSSVELNNAQIYFLARSSRFQEALNIFESTPEEAKNTHVSLWNTIISACGVYGYGNKALELFDEMQQRKLTPNERTVISALSACSHANLINKAKMIFSSMEEQWNIKPNQMIYACMIDVLSRGGYTAEAFDMLQRIDVSNISAYRSALSGCRSVQDITYAEKI